MCPLSLRQELGIARKLPSRRPDLESLAPVRQIISIVEFDELDLSCEVLAIPDSPQRFQMLEILCQQLRAKENDDEDQRPGPTVTTPQHERTSEPIGMDSILLAIDRFEIGFHLKNLPLSISILADSSDKEMDNSTIG